MWIRAGSGFVDTFALKESIQVKLPHTLYITNPNENFESLAWVHQLHENGVEGIILSLDEALFYEDHPEAHFLAYFHEKAEQLKMICEALGLILLIEDNVQVAHFSNSDGIYLVNEIPDLPVLKKENPDLIIGMESKDSNHVHGTDLTDFLLFTGSKSNEIILPHIACYFRDEKTGFYNLDV